MMSLEEVAFNLINVFESCKLAAYKDPVGIWTIGYGHTPATPGQIITTEQALTFFKDDCKSLFDRVRYLPVQEAAAWVSFGYNLGISTLENVLTLGVDHVLLYDKAHGANGTYKLPGLTARRKLEYTLIQLSRGN